MAGDTDIYALPLSLIPYKTRKLLSCLLNTTKILPSDGPDKLPRDWRGLASFLNISSEVAANIQQYHDKTAKVLDIWIQDGTATVGKLLEYLQRLDRYDVHDDILNDLREYVQRGELVVNQEYQVALQNNNQIDTLEEREYSIITFDDRLGYEHYYHAFVLYADEDRVFVDELYEKMGEGFQICTKEKLLPGHATEYAPVAQLISKRCQYIILVYSPAFLMSPANTFYRDYAQAVSIESKLQNFQRKIIPIMYKPCKLPVHLMYYHKLHYKRDDGRAMYDFWEKMRQSLAQNRIIPRLNGASTLHSAHSALNIEEVSGTTNNNSDPDNQYFLTQQESSRSISMNDLDNLTRDSRGDDDQSLSDYSQSSDRTADKKMKKLGAIKRMINTIRRKKPKNNTLTVPGIELAGPI